MRCVVALIVCALIGCAGADDSASDARRTVERIRELRQQASAANSAARFLDAANALRQAMSLCDDVFGAGDPDCADLRARLGIELLNVRRVDEALELFEAALETNAGATSALDDSRIRTLQALALGRRGDYQDAYDLAVAAAYDRRDVVLTLSQSVRSGDERDRQIYLQALTDGAHGFLVAATMAFRLQDFRKARAAGLVARNLMLAVPNRAATWLSFIDTLVAAADAELGEFDLAEERQELAARSREIGTGLSVSTAIAQMRLADVRAGAERTEEAFQTGLHALEVLEAEAAKPGFQGLDPGAVAGFLRAAYASAQDNPWAAADRYAAMFRASQLIYSGAAAQTLRRLAARLAAQTPDLAEMAGALERARAERDRLRVGVTRALPTRAAQPERFQQLRRAAALAEAEATTLEAEIMALFPAYAELTSAAPVDAARLGALLSAGEIFVSFTLGPRESFVFVVRDGGGVVAAPIALNDAEMNDRVRALRGTFAVVGGNIPQYKMNDAFVLYQALFGGVADIVESARRIVLAPVGPLLAFPFAALIDRAPTGSPADEEEQYARASWFGTQYALSYTPSVKAFANLRAFARPSTATRSLVGFADPSFRGGAGGMDQLGRHCQSNGATPPDLLRALTPLPGTGDELRAVARFVAGVVTLFFGDDATEDAIREVDLADYRIIYFATHGLLPGELRCQAEPGLALTPPQFAADRLLDGLLTASEVAALRLDADLVVLSACNTGGGDEGALGGEALSGLASAFFIAGARALLVSHWQVESAATTRLMSDAFARFRDTSDLAEAMRVAQADLARDPKTSHPFFWAAFTIIGDSQGAAAGLRGL